MRMANQMNNMKKYYLIVHEYTHTGPAAYLVSGASVGDLMDHSDERKEFCFEFDLNKLKDTLTEVEIKIVVKNKNNE